MEDGKPVKEEDGSRKEDGSRRAKEEDGKAEKAKEVEEKEKEVGARKVEVCMKSICGEATTIPAVAGMIGRMEDMEMEVMGRTLETLVASR